MIQNLIKLLQSCRQEKSTEKQAVIQTAALQLMSLNLRGDGFKTLYLQFC